MKPTLEFIEETQSLRKDYRNIARIFLMGDLPNQKMKLIMLKGM